MFARAGSNRSWWRALAAVVVAAVASPTLAQPSVTEFTETTILRIEKIAAEADSSLSATAANAVVTIERLDRLGKPNRTIHHYYLDVKRQMGTMAGNASARIGVVESRAIEVLTRMGASPVIIAQIQTVANTGRADVATSHMESLERVKRAAALAMQ